MIIHNTKTNTKHKFRSSALAARYAVYHELTYKDMFAYDFEYDSQEATFWQLIAASLTQEYRSKPKVSTEEKQFWSNCKLKENQIK